MDKKIIQCFIFLHQILWRSNCQLLMQSSVSIFFSIWSNETEVKLSSSLAHFGLVLHIKISKHVSSGEKSTISDPLSYRVPPPIINQFQILCVEEIHPKSWPHNQESSSSKEPSKLSSKTSWLSIRTWSFYQLYLKINMETMWLTMW